MSRALRVRLLVVRCKVCGYLWVSRARSPLNLKCPRCGARTRRIEVKRALDVELDAEAG